MESNSVYICMMTEYGGGGGGWANLFNHEYDHVKELYHEIWPNSATRTWPPNCKT